MDNLQNPLNPDNIQPYSHPRHKAVPSSPPKFDPLPKDVTEKLHPETTDENKENRPLTGQLTTEEFKNKYKGFFEKKKGLASQRTPSPPATEPPELGMEHLRNATNFAKKQTLPAFIAGGRSLRLQLFGRENANEVRKKLALKCASYFCKKPDDQIKKAENLEKLLVNWVQARDAYDAKFPPSSHGDKANLDEINSRLSVEVVPFLPKMPLYIARYKDLPIFSSKWLQGLVKLNPQQIAMKATASLDGEGEVDNAVVKILRSNVDKLQTDIHDIQANPQYRADRLKEMKYNQSYLKKPWIQVILKIVSKSPAEIMIKGVLKGFLPKYTPALVKIEMQEKHLKEKIANNHKQHMQEFKNQEQLLKQGKISKEQFVQFQKSHQLSREIDSSQHHEEMIQLQKNKQLALSPEGQKLDALNAEMHQKFVIKFLSTLIDNHSMKPLANVLLAYSNFVDAYVDFLEKADKKNPPSSTDEIAKAEQKIHASLQKLQEHYVMAVQELVKEISSNPFERQFYLSLDAPLQSCSMGRDQNYSQQLWDQVAAPALEQTFDLPKLLTA